MADSLVHQVHQNDGEQPEEQPEPKWRKKSCWALCCRSCWDLCCSCLDRPNNGPRPKPGGGGNDGSNDNGTEYLLPPLKVDGQHKKCLVLDLDETLVHSSFKPISDADFKIEIELEGTIHRVYVRKRPWVDEFLEDVGRKWEVVIFTASLAKYADPLLDILDRDKVVSTRLFREGCVQHYGNYVKDLSHLGRPLKEIVIIDNSPFSYMFQPDNAIPITSWFNDRKDRQLKDLIPFLDTLLEIPDIPALLQRKNFPFLETPDDTNLGNND